MIGTRRAGGIGLLVAGTLAVAGCGGGSTSVATGASYDQLVSGFEALDAEMDGLSPTPVGDMPVAGTASYAGFGELVGDGDVALLATRMAGEVDLTADFGGNTVSGRMSGLRSAGNQSVAGTLDITAGTITDNEISFAMSGDLSAGSQSANVTLSGLAEFVGAGAGYVDGAMSGTATGGGASGNVSGFFLARRQ